MTESEFKATAEAYLKERNKVGLVDLGALWLLARPLIAQGVLYAGQALLSLLDQLLQPQPVQGAATGLVKAKCCPEHMACHQAAVKAAACALCYAVACLDCCDEDTGYGK